MGTFAYGDSYFGLRSFDQSFGTVKDASASATAAAYLAPVAFKNAIGAQATMSSSVTTSASAQKFVLKESSPYSYGTAAYGSNSFGVDYFDVPISATSSTSLTGATAVLALRGASITATSGFAAIGGFLANASATSASSSGITCGAVRYRTGPAISAGASVTTSAATANFISGAAISTTSVVAAVGEQVIIEESDRFNYGRATYGSYAYGENANLQTVSGAVSLATAAGIRIQAASASMSSASSATSDSEQIYQSGATTTATTSTAASGVFIRFVSVGIGATSGTSATGIRYREVDSVSAGSSVLVALGRKKWEDITDESVTWTDATIESVTWNQAA